MTIHLAQTQNFDVEVSKNLENLLNKHKGVAKFKRVEQAITLKEEEIQARYVPIEKLQQKFSLSPPLITQIIEVSRRWGRGPIVQPNSIKENTLFSSLLRGYDTSHLQDLRQYTLLDLLHGLLSMSFLKQSYPLESLKKQGKILKEEQDVVEDAYVSSKLLFDKCQQVRKTQGISQEDFLILFTATNLDSNWIYSLDPAYTNTIIINKKALSYIEEDRMPAALSFYMVAGILAKLSFLGFIDWYLHQHPRSIGCIMDHNLEHYDACTTMRSADICRDCQQLITADKISFGLSSQLSKILNDTREDLLMRNTWLLPKQPYELVIEGYKCDILIPALGEKVNLSPIEKALYLTFLFMPEGCTRDQLSTKRNLINDWYARWVNCDANGAIHPTVQNLFDNRNSYAEKVARIKHAFADYIHPKHLDLYTIQGPKNGVKQIALDRAYVTYKNVELG